MKTKPTGYCCKYCPQIVRGGKRELYQHYRKYHSEHFNPNNKPQWQPAARRP